MDSINYTSKDFESLFEDLKKKATEKFPDWTDFSDTNIGVVLLELFAFVGDMLSYNANSQANEVLIRYIKFKQNMVAVCSLIDYILSLPSPAIVTLKFTLENTHSVLVHIKAGDVVSTADEEFKFEVLNDVSIPIGELDIEVDAKNWTSRQEVFDADGSINQRFLLTYYDYIQSTDIDIDGDTAWTQVPDFINSGPTDKHYKIEVDSDNQENDIASLVFGDGIRGLNPTGEITYNYKSGGGRAGNAIQPGKINTIISTILDDDTEVVTDISVTNELSPSSGSDAESIDEARINAPKNTKAVQRTVAREDFIINAESVSGVIRAQSQSKRDDLSMPDNTTFIYIVPNGGGLPSQPLKDAVGDVYDNDRKTTNTHNHFEKDPFYKEIIIEGTVKRNPGFTIAETKTAVDNALIAYFDYENIDPNTNDWVINFNMTVSDTLIISIIQNLPQVSDYDPITPTDDIECAYNEIPELGTLAGVVVI